MAFVHYYPSSNFPYNWTAPSTHIFAHIPLCDIVPHYLVKAAHESEKRYTTFCVFCQINSLISPLITESFLVIKTVGMQITTIFASGRKSAKFIAWERIQGVVINEAITMVDSCT